MARILIIDDDADVRAVMREILEPDGHDVIVAANGLEGLEAYRRCPADVVITDLFMPDKEGIETIHDLRRDFPGVRIIAMSGGAQSLPGSAYLSTARGLGATAVLSKPFDAAALLGTLARVLRGSTTG